MIYDLESETLICGELEGHVFHTSRMRYFRNKDRKIVRIQLEGIPEVIQLYKDFGVTIDLSYNLGYFLLGSAILDREFQRVYKEVAQVFGKEKI